MTAKEYTAALETLTANEVAALETAWKSSRGNGHDFGFSSDITVVGMNKKQVGGVISSLIQKKILSDVDPEFDQFCFVGFLEDGELDKYAAATLVKTSLDNRTAKPAWVRAAATLVKTSLDNRTAKPAKMTPAERMAWVRSFKK